MLPQRRNPVILSPLSPSFILSFRFFFFWLLINVLFNGLEVVAAFFGAPEHRNIYLQLSDASVSPIPLYLLSFHAPDDFPVSVTSPYGCEHCVKLSCRGRTLVWTSMLVNHSLASRPKAPTMLLLTAIQFGKKVGRRCSSTFTHAEVAITGQDGDVPREHLPPLLLCYANSSECITLGPLPAAMCVARCVRQLMRHKVSLFMPL